eukprot:gene25953-55765_t
MYDLGLTDCNAHQPGRAAVGVMLSRRDVGTPWGLQLREETMMLHDCTA